MALVDASRDGICNVARAELGCTAASRYWLDVLDPPVADPRDAKGRPLSWCGGFALWCYRQSGALDWHWVPGIGFALRLPRTSCPKPGDLGYIDQPFQHYAIVEFVDGNTITTIDGNSMGTVQRRVRQRAQFTAFFSIAGHVRPDVQPEGAS